MLYERGLIFWFIQYSVIWVMGTKKANPFFTQSNFWPVFLSLERAGAFFFFLSPLRPKWGRFSFQFPPFLSYILLAKQYSTENWVHNGTRLRIKWAWRKKWTPYVGSSAKKKQKGAKNLKNRNHSHAWRKGARNSSVCFLRKLRPGL